MKKKGNLLAMAAAVLLASGLTPAKEAPTAQKSWSLSVPLAASSSLRVENLLGTVKVRGTSATGAVKMEVRVVSEGATQEEAATLAGGVSVDAATEGPVTAIRVGLPAGETASALRLPREKDPSISRWVSSIFRKKGDAIDVDYRGNTYRIADDRKAPGLAVELTLAVPFGAAVVVRQEVGSIVLESSRGDARLETRAGTVAADGFLGSLSIDGHDADVKVTMCQGTKLDVATGTGKIDLLDVRASRVTLRTDSGAIGGTIAGADDLSVDSASGPVELAGVEPVRADIRAGTGNVDLSSHLSRTKKFAVRSDSGNVVLRLGVGVGFDLTAETPTGEVKSLGLPMTAVDKSGIVSRFQRWGGGPDLDVKAGAGSLTVRPYGVSRLGLLARKSGS